MQNGFQTESMALRLRQLSKLSSYSLVEGKEPMEYHSQTRQAILKLLIPYGADILKKKKKKHTLFQHPEPMALIPYCLRKQKAWRGASVNGDQELLLEGGSI